MAVLFITTNEPIYYLWLLRLLLTPSPFTTYSFSVYVLLLVVRRPSYNVYHDRHTYRTTAVVQLVLRLPYRDPIAEKPFPKRKKHLIKSLKCFGRIDIQAATKIRKRKPFGLRFYNGNKRIKTTYVNEC